MYKRRVFAWLCTLCLACSMLSGVAYGAGSLDDILQGADPWEDFEDISGAISSMTPPPVETLLPAEQNFNNPSATEAQGSGEEVEGEGEIMPFSLPTSSNRQITLTGFQTRTTGNDFVTTVLKYSGSYQTGGSYTWNVTNLGSRWAARMASGATLDYVTTTSSFKFSDIDQISIKGTTVFQFQVEYENSNGSYVTARVYPDTMQLLINGEPYGSINVHDSSGMFTVKETYKLTSNITSYGYRFTWSAPHVFFSASDHSRTVNLMPLKVNDSVSWAASEPGTGDVIGSVDQTTEEVKKTNGLLGSLIQLVQSIVSGIGTLVQSIGNIFTAITELPGKIWTAIQNGLQLLFVPSTDELDAIHDKWLELCETKFGFIYQAYQMLENVWSTLIGGWSSHTDYTFKFPGISFEMLGETYHVVEPQVIDFDNDLMAVLRVPLGTIVSIVCVLGVVNLFEHMFFAFISGKSYFDFLRGGGGEE